LQQPTVSVVRYVRVSDVKREGKLLTGSEKIQGDVGKVLVWVIRPVGMLL